MVLSYYHPLSAGVLAEWVKGRLQGNADLMVKTVESIESRSPNTLSFVVDQRYLAHLYSDVERTVLISDDLKLTAKTSSTLIRVPDVYAALEVIVKRCATNDPTPQQIHPMASVDASASLKPGVSVGPFCSIGAYTTIGTGASLADHVTIGRHVTIGSDCTIYSGARILDGCIIGKNVRIGANAVLGSDGFGFRAQSGKYSRIPHVGNVVIEDEVEIGANTCIDKASVGSTIIRRGAKLDNLIHVAHSVEIEESVAIAAQSGLSGSSKIGRGSQLGGQSGVAGHVYIPPGSRIQAQSGIPSDLELPGKKWYGSPAVPYYDFLRSYSLFKKLPGLVRRLEALERLIKK